MDDKDRALLALLKANARAPTAELARQLHMSRTTVKDRIERLERVGVIKGFTVKFTEAHEAGQIHALVMIQSDPKYTAAVVRSLKQDIAVSALYTVNGVFDMVARVEVSSTQQLDQALDRVGGIEGVEKTVSSIILATKFER